MTKSVDAAVRSFSPVLPVAVAYSGGADSTALLHACVARWPGQVVALHVNHQLQEAAMLFEQHCTEVCQNLNVPLIVERVDASPQPGQSPEDAARRARYKAFRHAALAGQAVPAIKSIALAQHADDQVETLLLALSRGAGLAGLSAMPAHWVRDDVQYYRPFLEVSSADIRAWLSERHLPFINDPTNADERFSRNRIRARLLPVLEEVFPQFRDTFARSAQHAAQGQEILEGIAAEDLRTPATSTGAELSIRALQALDSARQSNVLRHWLKKQYGVIASAAQLNELKRQIHACKTRGHCISIKVGPGFVQRSKDNLAWYNSEKLG
jgi:tRNA(Ile)-lysidine synthase